MYLSDGNQLLWSCTWTSSKEPQEHNNRRSSAASAIEINTVNAVAMPHAGIKPRDAEKGSGPP